MRYIVCDSLLKDYTWKGTTKKKPGFFKLKRICKTLYLSVKKCFRKYTQSKFNIYLADYVKQASVRYKRKLEQQDAENESAGDDDEDYDEENEKGKESGEESESEENEGVDEEDGYEYEDGDDEDE